MLTRRQVLQRCGMGMGWMALQSLGVSRAEIGASPLEPRAPHFPGKAKRVVHFFLNGGPSQVDTFDPKPLLGKWVGKPLPTGNLATENVTTGAFPSPFKFKRYGQCGLEVSELFEQTARHADELAVIRSMTADLPNHEPSLMLMNCGDAIQTRPSLGSWITYGLGAENQNLPAFIAMCPNGLPVKEHENWQSGFLPAAFQGTYIDPQHTELEKLIAHIRNTNTTRTEQRRQLDLLHALDNEHQQQRVRDAGFESRLQAFELAYRMQIEAADAFDTRQEPAHIQALYGEGVHARQTLIARRLLERGVRYVQLWHGAGQPWDSHANLEADHRKYARDIDQPIAALITDLKQRGMLEDTLIIWGGEFGRTPTTQGSNGRDHNAYGFTLWMAGAGVKPGTIFGATDEFGFRAVQNKVHVHDFHATILHLLGFDHERLTYRYAGRDFRLTDVHGEVIRGVLA
jgi:hypothetical protein